MRQPGSGVNPVYRIIAVRTAQAGLPALAGHWLLHWPLTGPHALGLVLTPLLCLYFAFVFVGRWSWGLPILTHLPATRGQEKSVALTFDDGPSPETTPAVLDVLRAFGVQATFFVLGEAVDRSPDILRRIVAEGHSLGIHGDGHCPFVLMNSRQIEGEIARACATVNRACPGAVLCPWLRPPHGFKSPGVLRAVHQAGFRLAGWSVDARDYTEKEPDRVACNVLGRLHPGAIILLHDGPANGHTAPALVLILQGLRQQGRLPTLLPPSLRGMP